MDIQTLILHHHIPIFDLSSKYIMLNLLDENNGKGYKISYIRDGSVIHAFDK
jgi:hypothetical protein